MTNQGSCSKNRYQLKNGWSILTGGIKSPFSPIVPIVHALWPFNEGKLKIAPEGYELEALDSRADCIR